MGYRLCFCLLILLAPFSSTRSALALSCLGPPEDWEEVTITGDVVPEAWPSSSPLEVPVAVGVVVEGTEKAQEDLEPGDRLALIDVEAGLRLGEVHASVEVVADGLVGWGSPTFAEGNHVFLRIEESVDLDAGIPLGPCSWNPLFSAAEIDRLLTLAEDHAVPMASPTPDGDGPTSLPPTTTSPPTVAPPSDPADQTPIGDGDSTAAPAPSGDDDVDLSTILVAVLAALAIVGLAAAALIRRR